MVIWLFRINDLVQTLQTNQFNRQDDQKFSLHGTRPKEFLRGNERYSRETEIEIETIMATPEAALIVDEEIKTVEHNCQRQESRTEAEICRARVVSSSEVRERKMSPLRPANLCMNGKQELF